MTLDGPSSFFAPRGLYGAYLLDLLYRIVEREGPEGRLQIIQQECVALPPLPAGVEVKLGTAQV
ncbi:MAG TPA: FAD/NAD(P)-binding protein [Rhizobiaceae bacterium]|nr:FAD/NAD(P)-binding protein [Rhizobiaceae bacterium]